MHLFCKQQTQITLTWHFYTEIRRECQVISFFFFFFFFSFLHQRVYYISHMNWTILFYYLSINLFVFLPPSGFRFFFLNFVWNIGWWPCLHCQVHTMSQNAGKWLVCTLYPEIPNFHIYTLLGHVKDWFNFGDLNPFFRSHTRFKNVDKWLFGTICPVGMAGFLLHLHILLEHGQEVIRCVWPWSYI